MGHFCPPGSGPDWMRIQSGSGSATLPETQHILWEGNGGNFKAWIVQVLRRRSVDKGPANFKGYIVQVLRRRNGKLTRGGREVSPLHSHTQESRDQGFRRWVIVRNKEFLMIYRRPGLLAVVRFGSSPTTFPPLPSVSSAGDTQAGWERETTCWRGRGEEGVGEKPNRTTAKSSINNLILSGQEAFEVVFASVRSGHRLSTGCLLLFGNCRCY